MRQRIASEQTFDIDNIEISPFICIYRKFPEAGEVVLLRNPQTELQQGCLAQEFPEDKPGISGPELTIAIAPSYRRQHLAKRIMAQLYQAAMR